MNRFVRVLPWAAVLGSACAGLWLSGRSDLAADEPKPAATEQATLKGHTDMVRSVAYSPDGKTVASGSNDKTIKLWDVATGKELATLKGHKREVLSVAFSPDGKTLASGGLEQTIRLWDVATGKELATIQGHGGSVPSLAYSPDGKTLASGGTGDGTVYLWDVSLAK